MSHNKSVKNFLDSEVFQLAYQASLDLHNSTRNFKGPIEERFTLAEDARRCSKSVCVYLAEAFGKQNYSETEFRELISKSIGAADEIIVRLMYLKDLGYMSQNDFDTYKEIYNRVANMLISLYKA